MDEVEVFELTQEEWDCAIQNALAKLNSTKEALKKKYSDGRLSAEEFKLYMLIKNEAKL